MSHKENGDEKYNNDDDVDDNDHTDHSRARKTEVFKNLIFGGFFRFKRFFCIFGFLGFSVQSRRDTSV